MCWYSSARKAVCWAGWSMYLSNLMSSSDASQQSSSGAGWLLVSNKVYILLLVVVCTVVNNTCNPEQCAPLCAARTKGARENCNFVTRMNRKWLKFIAFYYGWLANTTTRNPTWHSPPRQAYAVKMCNVLWVCGGCFVAFVVVSTRRRREWQRTTTTMV